MSDKPTLLPDLSASLTPELKNALRSYHTFCREPSPDNAKDFTAYHNACKSALMHIALLMKLIQATGESTNGAMPETSAETFWLTKARQALQNESEGDTVDDLFFD